MQKILKYLTIIPGAAMLLLSIYIMGIAQDIYMTDTVSVILKVAIYIVSLILVFFSISVILYALNFINKDIDEKEELEKREISYSKMHRALEIFGCLFWTCFVIAITYFGRNSIKGDILIIMILLWLSAIATLYKLISIIIKRRSN